MLVRFFVSALLILLLAGCHTLSKNEQMVVGTWEQRGFDTREPSYHVLKPDHSYAFVATQEVDGNIGHIALITGSWRIKGDLLIVDGTENQPSGQAGTPPRRRVNKEHVTKFLSGLTPHAPLTY